jgi:hypothetical protein
LRKIVTVDTAIDANDAARTAEGGNSRRPKPPRLGVRKRAHRCFELAGRGQSKDATWTLVHGIAFAHQVRHAWLTKAGWTYDPVMNKCMPERQYFDTYQAVVERKYSIQEAATMCVETTHWGPWHSPVSRGLEPWIAGESSEAD